MAPTRIATTPCTRSSHDSGSLEALLNLARTHTILRNRHTEHDRRGALYLRGAQGHGVCLVPVSHIAME